MSKNIETLASMAKHLEPVLNEVVFVGGCVTELLIPEQAAGDVRPTDDVDVIVAKSSYADNVKFSERLRQLGFAEDSSSGVICRWTIHELKLDVMPHDEEVWGFSNRWYKAAIENAEQRVLPNKLTIRVLTPPYFIATKLEAFKGRGKGDYAVSSDLEDMIAVIDRRPNIVAEVTQVEPELRKYISSELSGLLSTPRFIDALPGYVAADEASQSRLPGLIKKFEQIAALKR